jgi:pyruvate dehydrogenase E1 component alpha subunit
MNLTEMDLSLARRIYQDMLTIRRFEEMLFYLFNTRKMPGTMHQYDGEEAVAVGVCANLKDSDYITSTHRGHGHCIAKHAGLDGIMAEMFAKSTGTNRGMGGSMHIADAGAGILGANGIVGGGIPIAVGAAWSCQYRGTDDIAVAFFGDGASNEGVFHESLNLASAWKLPVLFVCENNLYGFSTHYRRVTNIENIADRGAAYGIPGVVADGMDVLDVYEKAKALIARARAGEGPALLECKTYRFRGHSRLEDPSYRTKEEVAEWKDKDPIPRFERHMKEVLGVTEEEISAIRTQVQDAVDAAVRFAEQSPEPSAGDYKQYIYA